MKRTVWITGVAAGLMTILTLSVVVLGSGDKADPPPPGRDGDRPIPAHTGTGPGTEPRGGTAPNLVVNPADESAVVELHHDLASGYCEVNASRDRGRTWTGGKLQAPAGYPTGSPGPCSVSGLTIGSIGQQSLAFGSGQSVYVSWASSPRPDIDGATVLLSRSGDGGLTFGQATEIPGLRGGKAPAPDYVRPELVVERRVPAADRLYVTTREARSNRAMVVSSDDGGATWSAPVEASRIDPLDNPPPIFTGAAAGPATTAGDAYTTPVELTQPVLGPKPPAGGERPLHVGWVALPRGSTCPPDCEAAGEAATDGYLVVATSTDGGRTWTRRRAVNVRGFLTPNGATFRGSAFPRLAGGPDGGLSIVFNQGPGTPGSANCGLGPFPAGAPGAVTVSCPSYAENRPFQTADHSISYDADVWFLHSVDGGATWGGLRQVNDPKRTDLAAPEITQTRHPQVAVAPSGRIDLVWEDRRHWYLSPITRIAAVTPRGGGALADSPCVQTHAACPEARLGDTYYAGSNDGGRTFTPNRRINDRSHNNDVGYDYRFSTYRDYGPSLVAVGATRLLVADMDSRLGNATTNTLDIFVREVDLAVSDGLLPLDRLASGIPSVFSVALSRRVQPGGSEAVLAGEATTRAASAVVIVNEDDPAAALVGGVLARANLGSLLASPSTGLPKLVKSEVARLAPVRAFILGDNTKLGPQVQADLASAGLPTDRITRISGVTPPDLAASVARAMDLRPTSAKTATPPVPAFDAAIIVNPADPSASSAAALAANRRLPILFTEAGALSAATETVLADLGISRTLVVGAANSMGPDVTAVLPAPSRLTGSDLYVVSAEVVRESVARGLPRNLVYVADGGTPMHAALLGAAVGRLGGLLLLAPGGSPERAQIALQNLGLRSQVDRLVISDLTNISARP